MQFIYTIACINISTYFKIPFLPENKSIIYPDIIVERNNNLDIELSDPHNKGYEFSINQTTSKILYANTAYIEIINSGSRVILKELNNFQENSFFFVKLINHVIPYCLYMKGKLVLHSSGISYKDSSVLFLGPSGHGKSSLAASLKAFNFISEDWINIEENQSIPTIPYVKLSNQIASVLQFCDKDKINIKGDRLSRALYKLENFTHHKKNISVIYFLDWGSKFSIKKIINLKEKLGYIYSSTYGPFPPNQRNSKIDKQFKQISKLLKSADIYKITRCKEDLFKYNDNIVDHFTKIIL